jgi:hypothetical protein
MTIKIVTPKNILIALLVLVVLYLLTCHGQSPNPVLTDVKPVKEQAKAVLVDSLSSKKTYDSFMVAIKEKDKAIETWYNEWKASETRYNDLEKGFVDLSQKEVPDTCKAMQQTYAFIEVVL